MSTVGPGVLGLLIDSNRLSNDPLSMDRLGSIWDRYFLLNSLVFRRLGPKQRKSTPGENERSKKVPLCENSQTKMLDVMYCFDTFFEGVGLP